MNKAMGVNSEPTVVIYYRLQNLIFLTLFAKSIKSKVRKHFVHYVFKKLPSEDPRKNTKKK